MKYIRTKDGRIIKFDTSDGEEEIAGIKYDILGFRLKTIMQFYNLQKEDIVKIADTIEELIDELVVHNPSNDGDFFPKYFVYKNKWETMLKPMSDYQKSKGIEIYGAIWTDKGLIYVAKMNDKGELCLIQ